MSEGEFQPLITQRLLLRVMEPSDTEAFFAYKSLPESVQFQFWRPETPEEVRGFIEKTRRVRPNEPGAWLQFAVCLKDGGGMIGDVGLHFSAEDETQAEIGYTLSPAHRGRGFATEAVRAALGYLYETLGKRRVTASVDPRNAPSAAVLERLGFRKEAHFRKSVLMDGEWCDDCVYAMLREEWKERLTPDSI